MKNRSTTIIITDDDDDDKILMQEALLVNGVKKEDVILASDGDELLAILKNHTKSPCLVFLDLNMPRKGGRETLAEIKSNLLLKHIPVIIFSTSSSYEDIISTYKSGSNTYFIKPDYFQELVNMIGVIKAYWFDKASIANHM